MYFVYVIRSQTVGKIYIGHTENLEKRLKEHNDPTCFSSKFTKRFPGPWLLIYSEPYPTRSEAFRRERWLKTGSGREYLRSLLNLGC
ncbi:MAG: GIY-YIG nuclease family protein [Verrucomicrobia bacterium]|nr:GIY-YIG nuclease family protein [Verrucomicrobiota bacterium]